MTSLARDVRYAVRRLLHQPGFSLVVVLTLALGIGANSTIFSVVNAILLQPLPYPGAERLIVLNHYYPGLNALEAGFAVPTFRDLRERSRIFETFAVRQNWAVNLTGEGDPERLVGARVSGEFFDVYGLPAARGRTIQRGEDEAGRDKVAVISDAFWQRRLGADVDVVGRKLVLDGEPYEIVGVMPPSFRDFFNRRVDVWSPVVFRPEQYTDDHRTNEFLSFIGRLPPGGSVDQARRDLTAFAEMLKRDHPDSYAPAWTLLTRSLTETMAKNVRTALLVLLGAVGLVLLIACVNVANLLLARGAARGREVALRAAVGATRGALVRQMLAESVLLSAVGAAFGLLLAYGAVQALVAINPTNLPRVEDVRLDATVLLFTAALAVGTGLVFGIVPAVHASRADLQAALREGGRSVADAGGHTLRRALVVAELAVALTLLVGAGLLVRSFARLSAVDPGFDPANVVTMSVRLPQARYAEQPARAAFFETLLERVEALPGVVAAGGTSNIPFGDNWSTGSFNVEGYQPPEGQSSPWGDIRVVSPGYHEAMRIQLVRGRTLRWSDHGEAPRVVVVDEEMVRRYWPDVDPIGRRVTFGDPDDPEARWSTVVGVVQHAAHEGLAAAPRVQLYFPFAQVNLPFLTLAVRTTGDPKGIVNSVRAAVLSIDRDQPIAEVRTMEELMDEAMGQRRLSMWLLTGFAGMALLLAALGIYGVMSFDVTRRSQELGVRMALGAARTSVLALVLRQGAWLAAVGVALGVAGALALTRVLQSQLYGVTRTDPATFAAVAGLLALVAVLATLIPAIRATRVDPVIALRYE